MEKLQYDSFYKFLVSVGVILVTGPFFGIYYLLSGSFDTKLSAEDLEKLSEASQVLFQKKTDLIQSSFTYLPYLLYALIIVGLFCLIWGSIRWYRVQQYEDSGKLAESLSKFDSLIKADTSQKLKKLILKIAHSGMRLIFGGEISGLHLTAGPFAEGRRKGAGMESSRVPLQITGSMKQVDPDALIKMLDIENACYEYYKKNLPRGHFLLQDFQIGEYTLDLIDRSIRSKKDTIYEIQYMDEKVIDESGITGIVEAQYKACGCYKSTLKRTAQPVLVIITEAELTDDRQQEIRKYASKKKPIDSTLDIRIEFLPVSVLQQK